MSARLSPLSLCAVFSSGSSNSSIASDSARWLWRAIRSGNSPPTCSRTLHIAAPPREPPIADDRSSGSPLRALQCCDRIDRVVVDDSNTTIRCRPPLVSPTTGLPDGADVRVGGILTSSSTSLRDIVLGTVLPLPSGSLSSPKGSSRSALAAILRTWIIVQHPCAARSIGVWIDIPSHARLLCLGTQGIGRVSERRAAGDFCHESQCRSAAGGPEPVILEVIADGATYGYEIARAIEKASHGHLLAQEGTLYPALHRLEKQGLLAAQWATSPEGRQRKHYQLTPLGRKQRQACGKNGPSLPAP